MLQIAAVALAARPRRQNRHAVLAGGDHDGARVPVALWRGGGPGGRRRRVHSDLADRARGLDAQTEVAGVLGEIRGELFARWIAGIAWRNRIVGETGQAADRVEPQPVIAPRPGVAEALILLENDGVDTASLERPGRRETRRPGADDDDGGLRHGVVSNAVGPGSAGQAGAAQWSHRKAIHVSVTSGDRLPAHALAPPQRTLKRIGTVRLMRACGMAGGNGGSGCARWIMARTS